MCHFTKCNLLREESCNVLQGKELLAFERYLTMKGRGGNHMQFNAVPIPMEAGKRAKEALFAAAKQHNISFKEVSKSQKVGARPSHCYRCNQPALHAAVGTVSATASPRPSLSSGSFQHRSTACRLRP